MSPHALTTATTLFSNTASSSSTLSSGGTPSSTNTDSPSISSSASFTASQTLTSSISATSSASTTASSSASRTLTPTSTGLSPYPYAARITSSGTGQLLNAIEFFLFDINNRNIGASASGSQLSLSTTYPGAAAVCPGRYCAANGGDLQADPITNGNSGSSPLLIHSAGTTTFDYYQVLFAAGPGYPGGYPTPISQAVFVNRVE